MIYFQSENHENLTLIYKPSKINEMDKKNLSKFRKLFL